MRAVDEKLIINELGPYSTRLTSIAVVATGVKLYYSVEVNYMGEIYMSNPLNFDAIDQVV